MEGNIFNFYMEVIKLIRTYFREGRRMHFKERF